MERSDEVENSKWNRNAGIKMNLMLRKSTIYPTLIWDDNTVILVDAGVPNSLPGIKKAMEDVMVCLLKA